MARPALRGTFAITFVLSVAAMAAACSGSPAMPVGLSADASSTCSPDLASIGAEVFAPSCTQSGCHNATDRAAGLDLTAADLAGQLVDVGAGTCDGWTRVVPGAPDKSLLYEKIAGTPPCGLRMPFGGHPLAGEVTDCIRRWIAGLPPPAGGGDGGGGKGDSGSAGDAARDASCSNTQTDPSNCGSCGKVCPAGASCAAGKCTCTGPLVDCASTCVDTSTSIANCGTCGSACPSGASCSAGHCVCPATASTVCGGACVSLQSDSKNCGKCGTACSAGTVCNQGVCAAGCGTLTQCGQSCVDTQTSFDNCGACAAVCPTGATCSAGHCQCPSGESACSGSCINTTTNPNDCGACGRVCASATTCSAGSCVCSNGGTLCGGTCVLTSSDTSNCGKCGNVCAPGQTCTNGACTCGSSSVSFSGSVQPIFTSSCALAGCHTGVAPQQGLNLSTGKSYASIVNVAARECTDGRLRVEPGAPAVSYVIEKLTNVNLCGGTQMPKTGSSLPGAQLAAISDWICEGAPNN